MSNTQDKFEEARFTGHCPACGQPFLGEVLEALKVLVEEAKRSAPGFHQMPCVLNAEAIIAKVGRE